MREKTTVDTQMSVPEIMAKFKVNRSTAWRAKQRGYFFGKTYHDRDNCAANPTQTARFQDICSLPAICVAKLASVTRQKPLDVAAGKSTLTCVEWKAFRQEILELRRSIKPLIKRGKPEDLIMIKEHPLLKYHVLFADLPLMCTRLSVGREAYADEIDQARAITRALYDNLKV